MERSEEPVAKKQRKMVQICTHSGSFHADEALGIYLLRLLPQFKDAKLVRSRNPKDWEESDIVIDVGGQSDDVKFFDHHQREFEGTFSENYNTKLSSAGLVYKKYGKDIIKEVLGYDSEANAKEIEILYEKVYKDFVESVDANDNGVSNYPSDLKPKFNEKNFTLASAVSNMNPGAFESATDKDFDEKFLIASEFMGKIFINLLNNYGKSWLPAKQFVEKAFHQRFDVHPSGKVILFDCFLAWKEHLYALEKVNNAVGEVLYVLFPDSGNNWRISAVPVSSTSFESRKKLPEPWRGLRDEELSEKTGVEGCVFIHAAGFIGGCKSKEGVLQLAKMAVDF